ncbi:hypothetical protein TWF106_005526 [Orbilia oligospora]|uniref:Uncharacterized protein n=1 Tax=Orbilia oligospora TaxID=2813651 RepID=A0A7C8K762_ORBOL|nr:hypothetical protein TWF788_001552 [Orbilia oligospora]KAF3222721.1 hypothetical protein TWF106_005526 [Orbilia oligospora]
MAPLPATSISHEPRDARFAVDASFPRLLHAAERIFKRDLGPSTGQSVGMAVGLSIAGIVVAIFVFGWVRYLAAREHQRAGLAQEAEKELEAAAEEPSS